MNNNAVVSTIFSKENSWRSDALDLLALFAQLAAVNAIRHRCSLARMRRGMGGMCCRSFLYGTLIAAVVAMLSLLASIWLWLYQAVRGETFVPQSTGVCSPWLGKYWVCSIWG